MSAYGSRLRRNRLRPPLVPGTCRARFETDSHEFEQRRARQRDFTASAAEALALRDDLARNGDVGGFRAGLQAWAVKPGTLAFNGYSGQGFVNQLVKRSGDHAELARVLSSALLPPADDDDAVGKLRAFTDYVESIRLGAHPAPGHSGFLLSYFWGLADHARWPVLWATGVAFIEFTTGETLPPTPAERYQRYLQLVRELDDDHPRFESVAAWWERNRPVFLDPVLADRCRYGLEVPPDSDARAANAAVLVSVARHLGNELVDPLSRALGRTLAVRRPRRDWADGRPRADLTVDWTIEAEGDIGGLGLRLWLNQNGVAIGLRPGSVRDGWYDEVAAVVEAAGLPEFRLLGGPRSSHGDDVGLESGRAGEFIYGRWFERDQLADIDVRAQAVAITAALQPTINELIRRAT